MRLVAVLASSLLIACGAAPADEQTTTTEDDAGSFAPAGDDAGSLLEDAAPSDSAPSIDTAPPAIDSAPSSDSSPAIDSAAPASKSLLGKYVLTWYSFQDNTPVNSAMSASGRKLIPYISVAIPFRLLKPFGGKLAYGDKLYVDFLRGRTMPNGAKHTGWVQIDDFCGDSGDDSYCYQTVGGKKYPNTDIYIGDYTKSGMSTTSCSGPAGSGQELTDVSTGVAGAEWVDDYGGKALGPGKCGNVTSAKAAHGSCWDYTPPASSASECKACSTTSCTSW